MAAVQHGMLQRGDSKAKENKARIIARRVYADLVSLNL